jgi:hypothetical protein
MTTKDIKKHLDRHDENLHVMYQAINAMANMAGTHKELTDTLTERIRILEEQLEEKTNE